MYASRRALARKEEKEGKVGLYLGQLGSLPELCPYETIGPEGENEEDAQAVRQDRPAVLVIGVDHGLGWVELRSAGIILQGGGVRKGARAKGAPKNGGHGNPLSLHPSQAELRKYVESMQGAGTIEDTGSSTSREECSIGRVLSLAKRSRLPTLRFFAQ
jgi:hypothetical protein